MFAVKLLLLAFAVKVAYSQDDNPCKSFGKDFQNGGTNFQNSLSTEKFTFVEYFEGCQADTAQNILVDPSGGQVQCTDTQLTPPDTDMLSTCPTQKNQLSTGEWSIVVISNNGNAAPIAYQRDFSLVVGPQQTTTYTPSVTVVVPSTPVISQTTTETDTSTSTAPQQTITKPSTTVSPTTTITPSRVTVTTSKAIITLTLIAPTIVISKTTVTQTASCRTGYLRVADHWARVTPTINGIFAQALATSSPKHRMARAEPIQDMAKFLAERHERLDRLAKRAPDQSTLTVTDTNTSNYPTVTSTSTAPAVTVTVPTTIQVTSTLTPDPVIVISGAITASTQTITAPTPTRTITKYYVGKSFITKTLGTTITITTKVTPAPVASACKSAGGWLG